MERVKKSAVITASLLGIIVIAIILFFVFFRKGKETFFDAAFVFSGENTQTILKYCKGA